MAEPLSVTPAPRLSLCVPTFNRAGYLAECLESALAEVAAQPPGSVEILVSDNGSDDTTAAVLEAFQGRCPVLRVWRFPSNQGFDANYLNCFREARGGHVWIMGDDDAWLPGSVARVLRELEADPDVVLCAPLECDLQMRPLQARSWFDDPGSAPAVWHLRSREDLARYFDALRFLAGAFAFISTAVIRRRRFLDNLPLFLEASRDFTYIHVWGMLAFLDAPAVLHWVAEPMFLNRTGNAPSEAGDPWWRGMLDLWTWKAAGGHYYGAEPRLRAAFNGVLRRNHQDLMVRRMRMAAADDAGRWREARAHLLAVGFDPVWVEANDLLYRLFLARVPMSPRLRPEGLCLADLPLLTLGARRAAVLVPGGAPALAEAAGLLQALRGCGRLDRILVLCAPDCAGLLDGFEVLEVDPLAFAAERPCQDRCVGVLKDFQPNLVVNADRARALAGDLLVAQAQAPACLGFRGRAEGVGDDLFDSLDRYYTLQLPADAGTGALARALGLEPGPRRLWPVAASREEAAAIFQGQGWDPGRTLALIGDDRQALAGPELPVRLEAWVAAGGTVMGLGGRGTFAALDALLAPLGGCAVNLAEALEAGTLAALLAQCGQVLGGGPSAALAPG